MCYQDLLNNNNTNQQLGFVDLLGIASFTLGLMNYNQNLTQNDKQDLMSELNQKTDLLLKQVHQHLKDQDRKLDLILKKLESTENDS